VARIFISNDLGDEHRADELRSALAERGHQALSVRAEDQGAKWYRQVDEDLENSDAVVVIVGSETSKWQESEIQQALEKSWQTPDTKIVPVMFGSQDLPNALSDFQAEVVQPGTQDWTSAVVQAVEAPSMVVDPYPGQRDKQRMAQKNSALRSWVAEQRKMLDQ